MIATAPRSSVGRRQLGLAAGAIVLIIATGFLLTAWVVDIGFRTLDSIEPNWPPPADALPLPDGWRVIDQTQCDSGCISIGMKVETTAATTAEARDAVWTKALGEGWTATDANTVVHEPFTATVATNGTPFGWTLTPGQVAVDLRYTSEKVAYEDRHQGRQWLVAASVTLVLAWLAVALIAVRVVWRSHRRPRSVSGS